jgi:hypothetical protein
LLQLRQLQQQPVNCCSALIIIQGTHIAVIINTKVTLGKPQVLQLGLACQATNLEHHTRIA